MSEEKNDAPAAGTITIQQAARLLQVTPRRIGQLISGGYVPRTGRGRVDLVAAVHGFIRALDDAAKRKEETASETRLIEAKLAEVRARIEKQYRELIPTDVVIETLDLSLQSVVAELSGLAARVSRDPATQKQIDKALDAALTEIVAARDEAEAALRAGREPRRSGVPA